MGHCLAEVKRTGCMLTANLHLSRGQEGIQLYIFTPSVCVHGLYMDGFTREKYDWILNSKFPKPLRKVMN